MPGRALRWPVKSNPLFEHNNGLASQNHGQTAKGGCAAAKTFRKTLFAYAVKMNGTQQRKLALAKTYRGTSPGQHCRADLFSASLLAQRFGQGLFLEPHHAQPRPDGHGNHEQEHRHQSIVVRNRYRMLHCIGQHAHQGRRKGVHVKPQRGNTAKFAKLLGKLR